MTQSEPLAQRARDALRIIENDPRARVRFVAAYTGHGDAVAALRYAADAAPDAGDDQRQRELRKVAFGRTHGPAEEEAAAQARRTLLEAEQAQTSTAAALDAAIHALNAKPDARAAQHPMEQPATPSTPSAAAPPPPPPSRTRLLWVIPVAVICLAVAYAAGSATRGESVPSSSPPKPSPTTTAAPAPTETPAPNPPGFSGLDATLIETPGDPVAAERWFDRPQQAQDTFDVIPMLAHLNIEPPDVRFVQTDLDGYSVWVAKNTDGEFCLLGSYGGMGYSTCAPPDQFAMSSLLLTQDHNAIRWDGITVTVSTAPDN